MEGIDDFDSQAGLSLSCYGRKLLGFIKPGYLASPLPAQVGAISKMASNEKLVSCDTILCFFRGDEADDGSKAP
jgi:hypothetical protein